MADQLSTTGLAGKLSDAPEPGVWSAGCRFQSLRNERGCVQAEISPAAFVARTRHQ